MLRTLIATLLLSAATAHAAAERVPTGQLPDDVIPNHYALDLTVIPEQLTFTGKVAIDVQLKAPTATLWMHGRDLTVSRVEVVDSDGTTFPATWTEMPKSDGVVKLSLAKAVKGPNARIAVSY